MEIPEICRRKQSKKQPEERILAASMDSRRKKWELSLETLERTK